MKPLAESLLDHQGGARRYVFEELERRMPSWLDRQHFLIGRRLPDTAEPEALDAWLDRELGEGAMRHE